MNDQQWIQACKQGDAQACRRLVEHYHTPLFAYFRGLGISQAMAEDILQETFLEVWRSLDSFRGDASLKTWLFVIGRRTAWRQLRRGAKQDRLLDQPEGLEDDQGNQQEATQEDWLWIHQRNEVLHDCIQALPTLYREILMLHYMEGLSYQEMAHVLDIATGTAKSRLNKALHLIRGRVQRAFQQDHT